MLDEYGHENSHLNEYFAVIYTPNKRQRGRFPENCVQLFNSAQAAIEAASAGEKRYPAKVVGPSRSSEGLQLYYLIHWLDQPSAG
jgi:hypothetical protein